MVDRKKNYNFNLGVKGLMGLTDSQELTKIDKLKMIVINKVYLKVQFLMTTMEKYGQTFGGWVVVWVRPHLNNRP